MRLARRSRLVLALALGALALAAQAPDAVARSAYVTDFEPTNTVSVIDTGTNQLTGSPIAVGPGPYGIAVTPDGRAAYATNIESTTVSVIDASRNQAVGGPIAVGLGPAQIAIAPDGKTAYVANFDAGTVSVINLQTNQAVGAPIAIGGNPFGIAMTPNGRTVYVGNQKDDNVSVIDTATNQVVGAPITVGEGPVGIAFTPDGKTAYVANNETNTVSVIETESNLTVGQPISDKGDPSDIAVTPDQPPIASFSNPRARPGVPVAFNATASTDPDGTVSRYDWGFGDQSSAANAGPTPRHAYRKPGTYPVTLTLTDNEGCSTALVFTGQTAYCNGSASASRTQAVKVAYPGVRVKCPRSAKPGGCRFKLQAMTKRHRGSVEARLAKVRVRAGKARIVSLQPTRKFSARLAIAKKILVRETVSIGNSPPRTRFRKLKVVQ